MVGMLMATTVVLKKGVMCCMKGEKVTTPLDKDGRELRV